VLVGRSERLDHAHPKKNRKSNIESRYRRYSTGAFVYPIRLAAPIALRTITQFLERERHSLDEVRMVLYTREDDTAYSVFARTLEQIISERTANGTP
jgi:O-acetyl-ADP-ribose deacetylase (regulator of RNase III)